MASLLSLVEKHPAIWRGNQAPIGQSRRLATGYLPLDEAILGGFPEYGVVRISGRTGIGELSLLKNVFTQTGENAFYLFVNPPGVLITNSLRRVNVVPENVHVVSTSSELSLWAAEEAIKSASCSVLLLWCERTNAAQVRRLQVAAAQHECLVVIFEPESQRSAALPVPLDLTITAIDEGLQVNIRKLQGGWPKQNIVVPISFTPNNTTITSLMRKYSVHSQDDALHG